MNNWKIFKGNNTPHKGIQSLPEPPSWRQFSHNSQKQQRRGANFQANPKHVELVNAALYLRRPLLVTGRPGTGKTSLPFAVAYELQLGEVLYWPITTRSTLKDGLYYYDAIGRLQDFQQQEKDEQVGRVSQDNLKEIGNYIQLGPLGTALLPSDEPRVLLIDEIDKSDIDLPNDLLHVFEEGRFEIPELVRIEDKLPSVEVRTAFKDEKETKTYNDSKVLINKGRIQCKSFPFVILTSNGERDFPPAFLRRCLRLDMGQPDQDELERIVASHFNDKKITQQAKVLIEMFMNKRKEGDLATDQLLNAIYLVTRKYAPENQEKEHLIEELLKYLTS